MTDPLRTDRSAPTADTSERDRDARVEQLLLAGLDHYFAGQYERALTVWTRVLFLEHGHARARAYMERARSAIAERQRESEELLHTGAEAFDRGDLVAARGLVSSAVERGAATDEALALLDRLHRLEPAAAASAESLPASTAGSRPDLVRRAIDPHPARWRWVAAGVAAGLVVAAAGGWLYYRGADVWLSPATTVRAASVARDVEPLPVPAASEVALARARTLQSRGRLHDALSALENVPQGDPLWGEAQTLRAAMQHQLLSGVGAPLDDPAGTAPGGRE